MSAICGMIDLRGEGRADTALVRRMLDGLRHRGGDGDGFYDSPDVVLGAGRQAVIDLRGGSQPLYNEDRSIALVFDGEIYNYRELRDHLKRRNHILQTDSDGETIIHLYEDDGLTLFSHLRGMYAFALWDANVGRLLLAVDHVGMKPLYLHERDGKLLFASEAKALFADLDTPRRLNPDAVDTYLSFGYMLDEHTLFEGIRRLPPGHACVVEKSASPRLYPFWQFPVPSANGDQGKRGFATRDRGAGEGVYITQTRELLAESVHIHLRSDVPLGLLLDGGLNSAAVLAFALRDSSRAISTFSLGYEGVPASPAQAVAAHFKTDHHQRIITPPDWWAGFEKAIYQLDEPLANPSAVDQLLLAEAAHQRVKTVLTGIGGDEICGGAPAHRALPAMLAARRSAYLDSAPLQNLLSASGKPASPTRVNGLSREEAVSRLKPLVDAVFSDSLRQHLYTPELLEARQHTIQRFAALLDKSWRDDPYDMAEAMVVNASLAGNTLLSLDKMTMAASLEARAPFLDPALLRFAAGVPSSVRLKSSGYLLREAARPYLPTVALDEAPPPAPHQHWLEDQLSDSVRAVLLNPNAFITDLLNRPALETLLKDHFWGRARQPDVVFRLLVLELWASRFLKPATFTPR